MSCAPIFLDILNGWSKDLLPHLLLSSDHQSKTTLMLRFGFCRSNLSIALRETGNSIPSKLSSLAHCLYWLTRFVDFWSTSSLCRADNTAHLKQWSSSFLTLMTAFFWLSFCGSGMKDLPVRGLNWFKWISSCSIFPNVHPLPSPMYFAKFSLTFCVMTEIPKSRSDDWVIVTTADLKKGIT